MRLGGRTLRSQLIFRYTGVLVVLLAFLGAFQYLALGMYLRQRIAADLRDQLHTAQSSVLASGHQGATAGPGDLLATSAELARVLGSPRNVVVVSDASGRPLAARGGPPHSPAREAVQAVLLAARSQPGVYRLWDEYGQPWLMVVEPLRSGGPPTPGGPPPVYAALATSLRDAEETLTRLLALYAAGSAIGLTLASLVAWRLLGGALRPLRRVVDASAEIAGGNLDRRVDAGGSVEVDRVAVALNHMLDEIGKAFAEERNAKDRLRRFLADAAHELRTPITAINGFLEVLEAGAAQSPADLDRALRSMRGEGRRLARLVGDLLRLARLDSQAPLERVPLDLAEVVRGLLPALEVLAAGHPLGCAAPAPVPVLGDADSLRQVVSNVVDNAAKYSEPGRPIRLTCRELDGWATLEVADEGIGIAPPDLARIFDRFFRSDRSRTRATGGAGLGLSLVQAITRAHGGKVEVESKPGAGTRVTVRLPLNRPAAPPPPAGHSRAPR